MNWENKGVTTDAFVTAGSATSAVLDRNEDIQFLKKKIRSAIVEATTAFQLEYQEILKERDSLNTKSENVRQGLIATGRSKDKIREYQEAFLNKMPKLPSNSHWSFGAPMGMFWLPIGELAVELPRSRKDCVTQVLSLEGYKDKDPALIRRLFLAGMDVAITHLGLKYAPDEPEAAIKSSIKPSPPPPQ